MSADKNTIPGLKVSRTSFMPVSSSLNIQANTDLGIRQMANMDMAVNTQASFKNVSVMVAAFLSSSMLLMVENWTKAML